MRAADLDPADHYRDYGVYEGRIGGGPEFLDGHLALLFAGSGATVLRHRNLAAVDGWVLSRQAGAEITLALDREAEPGWFGLDFAIGEPSPVAVELWNGPHLVACAAHRSTVRRALKVTAPVDTVVLRLHPDVPVLRLGRPHLRRIGRRGLAAVVLDRFWHLLKREPRALWPAGIAFARAVLDRRVTALAGGGPMVSSRATYENWMLLRDDRPEQNPERFAARLAGLRHRPLISVLMPVYETPAPLLDAAIGSVVDQIYPDWELCIANDGSPSAHVREALDAWAAREPRIRVVHREANGHIAAATNSAFALARGEWVALLDHDDVLRPHALLEMASEISIHPAVEVLYSDEDKIDESGDTRFDPHFKPDWSPDLFRAQNYLNHLTLHRADNVRAVGGWREGFEGSQDYDLNLRIIERVPPHAVRHVPKILYHWRAAAGSTAVAVDEKDYAIAAAERALAEHLHRCGLKGRIEKAPGLPYFRTVLDRPDPAPLVSLVIPTRDQAGVLATCLGSILEKTAYPNFEIVVVDNGSVEAETASLFERLGRDGRVRVLSYDRPFNFSAINNFAVAQARGSVVGLLNNDVEAVDGGWLDEMVAHAVRPEIGCVGAKLLYPDGRVQHGGIVLGIGGIAGHAHKYFDGASHGYFGRLGVAQNVSAVTGACLLVRKAVYLEVGGLDAEKLAIAFNDVDFCLKVRNRGYRNLWTPFATLVHHESLSRGHEDSPAKVARFNREVEVMRRRWGHALVSDPFYSPHLSLEREDFSLRLD